MSEFCDRESEELELLVGQAADDYTDRVNRGETVEVEEYARRYPKIADILRQMLPSLGLVAKLSPATTERRVPPDSGADTPESLGDYRILREIGRGGMGVVYEAEQSSLGRRVALKVLPYHRLMDPLYIRRFQREAQAAARLHHTNIVPVFGAGEHEGIHFYTMQFIPGHGLDRVIAELRRLRRSTDRTQIAAAGAERSDGTPGPVSSIAQSLYTGQFAAPLVDRTGHPPSGALRAEPTGEGQETTSLSDQPFRQYCRSVARIGIQVADALSYANGQGILHRDIKPSNLLLDTAGTVWVTDFGLAKSQATEDLTQAGHLVGTLRYAAPERLRGQSDARSDIFSLGLTLYELLTLRPAYAEENEEGLVRQVTDADPPAPRRVDRRIPSDLNTIILKATAKEPERRYATAAELAEDLRRFLEDRPILARRTGQFELAWRWCRRNRLVAGLGAGILAALLIGLGAALSLWRLSESQRRRAEANFQQARDAVDECFTIVTRNPALQEPGMEPARQVLFQAALKYYQDFLSQRTDDPRTRLDLGRAYYRLGYITERIGSRPEALAAYERGRALFRSLVESDPKDSQLRRELAQCHESLGELYRVTGRSDLAEAELSAALELREALAGDHPDRPDDRNDLATTHRSLGVLFRTTGRPTQAEASYRRAQALREQVLRQSPAHGAYRRALVHDYSELAQLFAASSRPVEAEEMLRQCLATLEELTRDYPDVSEYQDNLASAYTSLGSFLLNSGRGEFNQIERVYVKALDIRRELVRDHPRVQEYQSNLARVHNNLALWHYIANHDDQAADHYAKALALREQLASKHPDVVAYQKAAAKTNHDLGLLFRRAGRWSDADRSFRQALSIQERLRDRNREVSDFAIELVTTVNNLGLVARDQRHYQESVDWYNRAVRDLNGLLTAEPQQTDVRRLLGQAYAGRAESLGNLKRDAEALADWDHSLKFTRTNLIPGARLGRAAALARLGNYAEAVAEADRFTPKIAKGLVYLSAGAGVYAAAAAAVHRDAALTPEDRSERAERLAARAMDLLVRGFEAGEIATQPEVAWLEADRDLDALRRRADFVELLGKVQANRKRRGQ